MLDLGGRWLGPANRESQTAPVFWFRASATRLGLVRKVKGRLLVPKAVQKVSNDPRGLLLFIARAMLLRHRDEAAHDAALLALLELAAAQRSDWDESLHAIAFGLGALGWRMEPHGEMTDGDASELLIDTTAVFRTMGILRRGFGKEFAQSPEAQAFARAALQT
ncbi:hypothetical protein [Sinomonas mesophila]|uniref:hypothetical protein n=1 Tax=Sinomonas mesophila TaxID=1531955 RepID=UPI001115A288|nr:hypothetical protein [Sinomonas mesophila]